MVLQFRGAGGREAGRGAQRSQWHLRSDTTRSPRCPAGQLPHVLKETLASSQRSAPGHVRGRPALCRAFGFRREPRRAVPCRLRSRWIDSRAARFAASVNACRRPDRRFHWARLAEDHRARLEHYRWCVAGAPSPAETRSSCASVWSCPCGGDDRRRGLSCRAPVATGAGRLGRPGADGGAGSSPAGVGC
jgi:hypothetical protein